MLTNERVLNAMETEDGAGVRIKRLFPSLSLQNYDPFVLFDEFFLVPPAGFPTHPHRGFEAVTYMLEGGFHHRDTMGNDTTVLGGGAQYFVAGAGLEHAEMPGTPGMNHGIQLWVNLPGRLKDTEPSYRQISSIPIKEDNEKIVRAVVGDHSPLHLHDAVQYADILFKANSMLPFAAPEGSRGFVYVIGGHVTIEEEQMRSGQAFFFDTGAVFSIHAREGARILTISGKPYNEPIRLHGSFVD
jgi:redox-sensitive bicupin YhaK (pirin superfamily)